MKIQFLLDEEDTIEYYEALGRKKTEDAKLSAEASINSQVNRLDHVGQLELVHGKILLFSSFPILNGLVISCFTLVEF